MSQTSPTRNFQNFGERRQLLQDVMRKIAALKRPEPHGMIQEPHVVIASVKWQLPSFLS